MIPLLIVAFGAAPVVYAQPNRPSVIQGRQAPSSVAEIFLRLIDQDLSIAQRRFAATQLLILDNRDSLRALRSVLSPGVEPSAWRAVAEAIALRPEAPPDDLVDPLVKLLGEARPPVQAALAQALGRYHDDDLIERLYDLAADPRRPIASRCGALLALGHQRTQDSAEFLLKWTDRRHPPEIQQTAFTALADLTGLSRYGQDRSAWMQWWDSARRWSDERWRRRLLANFARRDLLRREQQRMIQQRLLQSQRALYRTTTPEDRSAVLAYMLGDDLTVIRQLGIDLALQRLVDDLPFDPPLREALRRRVNDPDPDIRRRATLLLRDLADRPAADLVADQLADRTEQSISVLRAYLLMMDRLPRARAVAPALELLDDPRLMGEAAGALASAAEVGMLDPEQVQAVAEKLHAFLDEGVTPPPQVARLLGQVAQEGDWDRIAGWIDSSDPALKRAAARAWADSDHSLKLLADRAADPIIQPIVTAAATRQGDDPWTLRALAKHRPTQPGAATEAWEAAIVALAGRVPPPAVLDAARQFEADDALVPLAQRVLGAALNREDQHPATPEHRVSLLLERAEVRLAAGQAEPALDDFQRVADIRTALAQGATLSAPALDRLHRGRMQAYLLAGQPRQALDAAQAIVGDPDRGGAPVRTRDPAIVDAFLDAARRLAQADRRDPARQTLLNLRLLLGPTIKPEIAQRIALAEARIARGAAPVNPPADSPAPSPAPDATPAPAPTRSADAP